MAKEYIEREATVMKIREWFWSAPGVHPKLDRDTAEDILFAIPAADVRPVARGRWIKLDMHSGMEQHKCSVCNQECYVPTCMGEPMYNYCPNCGAKMEV